MPDQVTPTGWPKDLPPPASAEFANKVVSWLLDLAPAEFRGYSVLRKHPAVLGWAVALHLEGEVQSLRQAYSQVRATFSGDLDAMVIEQVLEAFEFEGVRLTRAVRHVGLVNEALAGHTWRERL